MELTLFLMKKSPLQYVLQGENHYYEGIKAYMVMPPSHTSTWPVM